MVDPVHGLQDRIISFVHQLLNERHDAATVASVLLETAIETYEQVHGMKRQLRQSRAYGRKLATIRRALRRRFIRHVRRL